MLVRPPEHIGLSLPVAVSATGLFGEFGTHVDIPEGDFLRVVHEPVHDRVRGDFIGEHVKPVIGP